MKHSLKITGFIRFSRINCIAYGISDVNNLNIYGTKVTRSFSSIVQPNSSDDDILQFLKSGKLSHHKLESVLNDTVRSVKIRREFIKSLTNIDTLDVPIDSIESKSFYDQINGANCETVIGFIPLPIGIAGPLILDGKSYYVPMATTEGALIASTNRGARAISLSGGATTVILKDGMTRAPCIQCDDLSHAAKVKSWIELPSNFVHLQNSFSSTTRYGKLEEIQVKLAGRLLFIRLRCTTGDAMGMNMIGKGSNEVIQYILNQFPTVKLMTLSGNYCIDKKPSAVNWIEGRGKSVAAEAIISSSNVSKILKTTVDDIITVNIAKNLIGSSMAGSIGGNNAHAANMLTAVYLATGQDPAQNVESSNCITIMEKTESGDLRISITMPCIEVGTVGGGTSLKAQNSSLKLLGIAGANKLNPGDNAKQLARIIAGTVLAGELSLMAALSVNHLVSAHMQLNRKPLDSSNTNNSGNTKQHRTHYKIEHSTINRVDNSWTCDETGFAVTKCPIP